MDVDIPFEDSLNFNENDSFNSTLIISIFIGTFSLLYYLNYLKKKKIRKKIRKCKKFNYSQIKKFKKEGCHKIPKLKNKLKKMKKKLEEEKKLESCLKMTFKNINKFENTCKTLKNFKKKIDKKYKILKRNNDAFLNSESKKSDKILKCLGYKKYNQFEADNCKKFKETKNHYKKLLKKIKK
jgi:hypothetical protein